MPDDEQAVISTALRVGADAAMRHFRKLESVERKDDGTPATIADRQAEEAIIRVLRDAYPDDAILGEEGGQRQGTTNRRWIIDPIDGTRAYARGATHWGPLIALEEAGTITLGAAALPALDEIYIAQRGQGARRNGEHITTSCVQSINEAIASLGSLPRLLSCKAREGVTSIVQQSAYAYAGNDLAGALMLARGHADLWIEVGVQVWDIAALKVIVEEAGGVCTDFAGGEDLSRGEAIAAATPELHGAILHMLRA